MFNTRMDYQICEYMVCCRSRQLREKTMNSYEQSLRLFERWCREQMPLFKCQVYSRNWNFASFASVCALECGMPKQRESP